MASHKSLSNCRICVRLVNANLLFVNTGGGCLGRRKTEASTLIFVLVWTRKMNGRTSFRLVLFVVVNFLFSSPANAGVVKRSIRMVREIYPPDVEPENEGNQPQVCIVGDVVYGAEETVPAEQPCLKCRCQPPGVQCETVQCAKKPGCKAIHRPNKCCPDYQCECEHDGKIYANGEKLETNPGGECKVCYCRGGEVQCAEVSCYIRNDCEGKRVSGTCCPKYDHCPPIDAVPDRSAIVTEAPLNTLKPIIILEPWQEPNTTEVPSGPTLNNIPEDSNKVPDTSDLSTVSPLVEELSRKEEELHPRITIQEIIPERKEIPITAPPKIFISEPQGTLLIEEALPTRENTSNDLNIDSEPESSEVSEIFQHPPPVLRIGDRLLFLKRGDLILENYTTTPDSVITIIGAEGLQRGGVEESLEVHEVKIEPENNILKIQKDDNPINLQKVDPDFEGPLINISSQLETVYEPSNLTKEIGEQAESNDLELKPAESTHILSLVKRKDKTMVTTSTTHVPTTQKEEGLTTLTSSIEEPRRSDLQNLNTESTSEFETTTLASSYTTITPTTEALAKNTDPVIEQNPAYPPIPDIMPGVGDISQKFEVELENDNATTMEIKILPEVFDFLSNKTKNQTLQAHSEWLKAASKAKKDESLTDFKAGMLPDELLNQKSPIDEEEENSTDLAESSTITSTTGVKSSDSAAFTLVKDVIAEDPVVETTTEQKTKQEKGKLLEQEAQLIAEVKISDNVFDDVESLSTTSPSVTTTLNSILEALNTSVNNMIADNKEYSSSNATDDKDIGDAVKEAAAIEEPKLIESLEIDSGELTTPKTNHSSILSEENASVESIHKEDKTEAPSEITDMTQVAIKGGTVELGSVEVDNSESLLKDVEIIVSSSPNPIKPMIDNVMKQDVELINLLSVSTPKPTKLTKVETSTYELLPTPEEAKSKTIIKREIPSGNSEEDVFKELEQELNADSSYSAKSPEEERAEADQIFKELLEESEGKRPEGKIKSKEQEKVDNISNALAGVALKGKLPDANMFKLIGELFGGQRV